MKNRLIDKLIRDIAKAGFMPKSEARRRMQEILDFQKQKAIAKIQKRLNYLWKFKIAGTPAAYVVGELKDILSFLEQL